MNNQNTFITVISKEGIIEPHKFFHHYSENSKNIAKAYSWLPEEGYRFIVVNLDNYTLLED